MNSGDDAHIEILHGSEGEKVQGKAPGHRRGREQQAGGGDSLTLPESERNAAARVSTMASHSGGLEARLLEEGEGKQRGACGLYSRGCLATNQGLNGEKSMAEITGVSGLKNS